MTPTKQFQGIVNARSAAARSLVAALKASDWDFGELDLANKWLGAIQTEPSIYPTGWYQPPPYGMSVLVGHPPSYARLRYRSLREQTNYPRPELRYTSETILYPYFSAIDKRTLMIGDHVATYYRGNNKSIREWFQQCYYLTKQIASSARIGMRLSELHEIARELMAQMGASNNTYSLSGGLAADIGHTIPLFGEAVTDEVAATEHSRLPDLLAKHRKFVSAGNETTITAPFAFTIEPQILIEGYPMASFHMIVVFLDQEKYVIEKFREIFDLFGMRDWIYRNEMSGQLD